ncbi:2,3-diaminopropionate biosynthesis protein SbnB [Streptomyces lydicus]
MLVLRKADVGEILNGKEKEHIELVRQTYALHAQGATAVPHSTFLRFPDDPANRIIGLPSYRGGKSPAAGLKWISSFPANIHSGIPRASAVMVLNSLRTGHPEALLEASLISAARTAASAALAADILTEGRSPGGVSLIGCGVINFEVLRYLGAAIGAPGEIVVHDPSPARAEEFVRRCHELLPDAAISIADSVEDALAAQRLVSFGTNAGEPHADLTSAEPGTVVLHVSLRDIEPLSINGAHNIVDDADHVCRERTSLHLTEQMTGSRAFIDASIGQLINGTVAFTPDPDKVTVYSPFGLGVLDLALAVDVQATAREHGIGIDVADFLS